MDHALDIPPEAAPSQPPKLNTAAFKAVPETRELRDRVRAAVQAFVKPLDKAKPLTKDDTKAMGERLLADLGLGGQYLGFTMVMLTNEFWRDQVAAIPFHRRLMLLPHCLKNAEGCPAEYDELGLDCKKCGACEVGDFRTKAEQLGYKVLVSEGTPIVLKIIVSGHVDAIVGVACLNVLEKAFDKVLLAGIPCIATPLLSSNCKNTSVDNDWVFESIGLHTPPPETITKTYVRLMRAANAMFDEPELTRLVPRVRATGDRRQETGDKPGSVSPVSRLLSPDPLARHETIAYDFLARGGKRSRPLMVLAAYDALTGGKATLADDGWTLSDPVKRAALAIETFHKASLVHDDIEDDDAYRYGHETLHRTHGTGVAINVGDYLIGLGYRLVSRDRKELGAEVAADILDKLADAHLKLSEGQGAELLWRDAADQLEKALKLDGQPRVIVLHEKKGKVHAHIVWQREKEGKLIKMSHTYRAHDKVRASLEREHQHQRTRQTGDHKKHLTALWTGSRDGADFVRQAERAGYRIARGDRRAYVVETEDGQKLDLVRQLEGVKTKAAKERLQPVEGKLRAESELGGRKPQREGERQRVRRSQERTRRAANDNQPDRESRVREAGQGLGDIVGQKPQEGRQPGEAERFDQQLAAMRENMRPDQERQKAQEKENAQDTTESEAERFARKLEEYRRDQEARKRDRDHGRT